MRKTARITIIATGITSVLAAGSTAMALSVPAHHDGGHHHGDNRRAGQATSSSTSQLDGGAAARAALTRLPDGRVSEIERETEHGRQLWEIDLTRGGRDYEALVDATGKVVSLHADDGHARTSHARSGTATALVSSRGIESDDARDRYDDDGHDTDHDGEGDHDSDHDSDHGEVDHDD